MMGGEEKDWCEKPFRAVLEPEHGILFRGVCGTSGLLRNLHVLTGCLMTSSRQKRVLWMIYHKDFDQTWESGCGSADEDSILGMRYK